MHGFNNLIKITAALLFALIISLSYYAADQLIKAQTERAELSRSLFDVQTQEAFYGEISRALGYGGFIHHFKNYVLRQNPVYIEQSQRAMQIFESRLLDYVRAHNVSEDEFKNLKILQNTIVEYRDKLRTAENLVLEGKTANEIDAVVAVDDTEAFAALSFFNEALRANMEYVLEQNSYVESIETRSKQALIFSGIAILILLTLMALVIRAGLQQRKEFIAQILHSRDMLDATSEAFITVDHEQTIISFNAAAERLFGWEKGEIIGASIEKLISNNPSLNHKEKVDDYFHSKFGDKLANRLKSNWREVFAIKKNGTTFPVEITLSKFKHAGKSFATAIVRDMTTSLSEIIAKENDLSSLVESTKQKSVFLATMSHEVRTPLAGIMGVADLLATEDLPPSVMKNIEIIRSCGKNLGQILNDILDLSKIDSGKLELHFEPFMPARLLNDIKSVFTPIAEVKKIKLVTTIKENYHKQLMGDAARIRQVLFNLVSNAIKFTDKGSVIVEGSIVKDSASPKNAIFRVDVIDSGSGIPDDKLDKIFDEFEQADNGISRSSGGTGLGLAISKRLVDQMGGKLIVNSMQNKGSTFSFAIPLEIFFERRANPRLTKDPEARKRDAENLNILLVEDFAINRTLIMAMLEKHGHRITAAEDGKVAMEKAKKTRFDLILMDVHMPNINGIDAFRFIRRDSLNMATPVIAITADVMVENVRELKEIGFSQVVAKPIDWEELTKKINLCVIGTSEADD